MTIEECTRSEIESCSHVTCRENIFLIFFFFFFLFFFLAFSSTILFTVRRTNFKIYLYRVFDREVAGLKSGSSSKQIEFHFRPIRISMSKFNGEILNFFSLLSIENRKGNQKLMMFTFILDMHIFFCNRVNRF